MGLGLFPLLLVVAACVSEVEREETPTPGLAAATTAPTPTFTLGPPATLPPTPTTTAVAKPPPTPKSSTIPLPSPTAVATEEPALQLALEVNAPKDSSTVLTDAVVVHGTTTPGALIEGVRAQVGPDGRFQAEVPLAPGINTIRVVATDSMNNREIRSLDVTSLALPPQPFLLLVTEPEDQSIVSEGLIRLSGRTGAEAIASVNGVSVPVDELGFFSTTVTLEPGPNIIDVVATDDDGQVLSTVIAVIYRP